MALRSGILSDSVRWSLDLQCSAKAGHERAEWLIQKMLGQPSMSNGLANQPLLPFRPTWLYPHYIPDLVEQHYLVHCRGVGLLNAMLLKCRHSGERPSRMLVRMLLDAGSEHILHCLFWDSLCQPGSQIGPATADAMCRSFGSTELAEHYFAALCDASHTRGWGVLGYNVIHDKLAIFLTGELVNMLVWPVVPLLVCDLWEHAYQMQYSRNRRAWVDAFLRMTDWQAVERRCMAAMDRRREVLRRA